MTQFHPPPPAPLGRYQTKIDYKIPLYFNLNSFWLYHVYGENKMGLTTKYKTGGISTASNYSIHFNRGGHQYNGGAFTR